MKLSFSSISTWVNCPRQFYECYVLRKWYKDTPQTIEGTKIHAEIEAYLKGGAYPTRAPLDDLLVVLRSLPTPVYPEVEMAVDRNGNAVPYKDESAVIRGKIDVLCEFPDSVWVIDWKTGKKRDNSLQAAVYGVLLEGKYKEIPIRATFDYLEKGREQPIHHDGYARKRVWDLVADIEADKEFKCKPSGLCGWCNVETCKHRRAR